MNEQTIQQTDFADQLITKQAAIDALGDEPEVWTGRDEYAQGLNNQWHYDRNAIKAVPSAQPEIIRCRDCKHYYFADNRIPQERRYTCDLDGDRWSPDSYCSFAERRTDE